MTMTVQDILDAIHIGYEQAVDTPSLNDEDGEIRFSLVKKAVRRWASDNTTLWNELFELVELGPIEVDTQEYTLSANYNLGDAFFIEGNSRPLRVVAPHQLSGETGRFITVLGNKKDGYRVRLGWKPAAEDQEVGLKIIARTYRDPFIPESPSDKLEMSDPEFAVAFVIGELFINDEPNLYTKFNNDALLLLANMRQRNERVTDGQFNGLETNDGIGMGIGE